MLHKKKLDSVLGLERWGGMLQGRSERGGQDPHPPPSPQPRMKTSLFMTCSIQHCACIRDAKKSNVNISEDRIKENFIKRFLKQNSSVSGRRSVNRVIAWQLYIQN